MENPLENPSFTPYHISLDDKQSILSNVFVVSKSPDKSCTCQRKQENIKCGKCDFGFYGKRRIRCAVHPNVIHLMDVHLCPRCNQVL